MQKLFRDTKINPDIIWYSNKKHLFGDAKPNPSDNYRIYPENLQHLCIEFTNVVDYQNRDDIFKYIVDGNEITFYYSRAEVNSSK